MKWISSTGELCGSWIFEGRIGRTKKVSWLSRLRLQRRRDSSRLAPGPDSVLFAVVYIGRTRSEWKSDRMTSVARQMPSIILFIYKDPGQGQLQNLSVSLLVVVSLSSSPILTNLRLALFGNVSLLFFNFSQHIYIAGQHTDGCTQCILRSSTFRARAPDNITEINYIGMSIFWDPIIWTRIHHFSAEEQSEGHKRRLHDIRRLIGLGLCGINPFEIF